MSPDLQLKLKEKYPNIFRVNTPPLHPFDIYGFESWDGWYDLIDRLAAKIQFVLDKDDKAYFYTLQSKQKFARYCHYFSCDKENYEIFSRLVFAAEKESLTICEKCGTKENVSRNEDGYILTLCPKCRAEFK